MSTPVAPPASAPVSLTYVAPVAEQAARNERQAGAAEKVADQVAAMAQEAAKFNSPPTDAELVAGLLPGIVRTGIFGMAAVAKAKETVAAYRFAFKGIA